ncbi:hypothetical protein H5410_060918, partial [Solanum commersonii]
MSNQDQLSGNSESLLIKTCLRKNQSKLPYDLIVQILYLLSITNTFKEIILSKVWQYFWTCINNIVYNNEEYDHSDSLTVHKFISSTDNVLPLRSCSTIKKFTFNFVFRYDNGECYITIIDKWLEFAVNRKVEDLRLNIRYRINIRRLRTTLDISKEFNTR